VNDSVLLKTVYVSAAYLDSCDAGEQKRLLEHEKITLASLKDHKSGLDLYEY